MPDVEGLLAAAGILDDICDNFEILFDRSSSERIEQDIKKTSDLSQMDKELESLLARLNSGISAGRYELIPDSHEQSNTERLGVETRAVEELLRFPVAESDLIVIDDRFLNRHSVRIDDEIAVPIVCLPELLRLLFERKIIEASVYYRKLLELRQMNYRYLPLSTDEILYYVSIARLDEGILRESDALRVLRQYQASCLLDKELLQIAGPSDFSESQFIMQSVEAILGALTDLWKNGSLSIEDVVARSNWLLDNLYTGHSGAINLATIENEDDSVPYSHKLFTLDLQLLFLRGVFLIGSPIPGAIDVRRIEYYKWVDDRLLRTNAAAIGPAVYSETADFLKQQFQSVKEAEFPDELYAKLSGVVLGRLFLDLPESIRNHCDLSDELKAWLHVRVGNTISAGELDFEPSEYWPAIERAVQGGEGIATPIDSEQDYRFTRYEGDGSDTDPSLFPPIEIRPTDDQRSYIVHDPSFGLFAADEATRIKALETLRHIFDCDKTEFTTVISEIARIRDPSDRAAKFFQIREQSVWNHYKTLKEKFAPGALIAWSELLPPAEERIFRYYRISEISSNETFADLWEKAVERMLEDDGIETTISKCSKLPLSMPEAAIATFRDLSTNERLDLIRRLLGEWSSPMRLLHLVNLLATTSDKSEQDLIAIAQEILDRLYSPDYEAEFDAFLSVFWFIGESLDPVDRPITYSGLFSAWTHSSALYQILRGVGNTPQQMKDAFLRRRGDNPLLSIERSANYRNDCSSPIRVNRINFLTHAAARLFVNITPEMRDVLKLRERIENSALKSSVEGIELPVILINSDPLLCFDSLCSLFGGDRFEALSSVADKESLEYLKSANLQRTVAEHLQVLINEPSTLVPWLLIYLIAGDLPLGSDLKDTIREALLKFNAENLPLTDDSAPSYIVLAAAKQAGLFADDVPIRSHIRDQILKLQKILPSADSSEWADHMRSVLVDAILALCRNPNPQKATRDLVLLLEELYKNDRGVKSSHGYLIERMTTDAHSSLSWHWWKLRLLLRTNPVEG